MNTLNGICFVSATAILIWTFAAINYRYFLNSMGKKQRRQNCIKLLCISPFLVHIMSQATVCGLIWVVSKNHGKNLIQIGLRSTKVMIAIIILQFIMLPIIIRIYANIINKDRRICAFIYITMLSMISFIDEIATSGYLFLLLTIVMICVLKLYFKKDVEIIVKSGKMANYDNVAMLPIFAYAVVLALAVLWNASPVEDIAFRTSFSILCSAFCVFIFTTYKYAFGNYIKQVEILDRTKEKKKILEEQNKTQEGIILSLAEITEAKSGQTGKHVKRVSEYTRVLAEALEFTRDDVEKMRVASMMHDIGKLMIPSEILDKKGKLTSEEFDVIKTHASLGEEILHNTNGPIMDCAKIIALDHHEKWDGNGYNGKKGREISIEGRIVAVADVFDALVSKRSYKDAWDEKDAKREIIVQSGKQFDPNVVEAFVNHYNEILDVWEKI